MGKLNIQLCPETGICSVIKEDGKKIDMIPGEVDQLREAAGNHEKIKAVLTQVDAVFCNELDTEELDQLSAEFKYGNKKP